MLLGKRWLFSIGNGAEILPLERAENHLTYHILVNLNYSLNMLTQVGLEA